tara:strand:+ start:247 stop:666 length:420 start_codon:yes stop_codon:yes gene_type:complete
MQQSNIPTNPEYIKLRIETVNNSPTTRNVLFMQKVLNAYLHERKGMAETTGFGRQFEGVMENGILNTETKSAVAKVRKIMDYEQKQIQEMQFQQNLEKNQKGYDESKNIDKSKNAEWMDVIFKSLKEPDNPLNMDDTNK